MMEEPASQPSSDTGQPTSGWAARQGSASTLVGGLLILLGVVFLVVQALHLNIWEIGWPFFIIVPGVTAFALAVVLRGRAGEMLVVIGSIMTVNGLLLLYQNSSGHWESWAYGWALVFPTSVGLGLLLYGWLIGNDRLVLRGSRLTLLGVALFMAGAIFFEGVINISGHGFNSAWRLLFPALLIAAGGALLFRAHRRRSSDEEDYRSF